MKLKKKENYNYFDEFTKNVGYALSCAKKISETLISYDKSQLSTILEEIHNLEHLGDTGQHKMTNYLIKDFLPPIEREDILSLSQMIDDLIDLIEEILINIDIFNVDTIQSEAITFSNLLVNCCEYEKRLLENFKDFKKNEELEKIVIKINALEEQGDKLYIDVMKSLYKKNKDALEIMKWTTIYNCFENSIDQCEHLANEIENVILKNI